MAKKEHNTGNLSPEFALMGFLIEKPSHGYDLHQRLTTELGQVWHLSQSQAYAILKRLETRGDISARMVAQEKLPARQMLHITASGRKRFFAWLETEISTTARSVRLEFLTRLYFANLYRPEIISQIYQSQLSEIDSKIEKLETLIENLSPEQTYNHLSLDLRLRQMKLIQSWMAEIKTQFHISRIEK
ncbi:MAG TPA: helix-turn-helix transcriptional regulator [Anaerolineales bacterium]|nr:helix-turn-helix transcriptional regulator [Anaerolineales bacterium]